MRVLLLVLMGLLSGAAVYADGTDPLDEGRGLLDSPERERGVALLRTVIAEADAAPKDARKQQRAGRARMALGEDREAVAAMERAAALEPKNARFAFWVGAASLDVDVDRSIRAFTHATELDPRDPDGWFGLGRARDAKGELAGAVTAFRKAVELDPTYADAFRRAGSVLERLGRDDEAIASYRKALELEPERVGVAVRIGWLDYVGGRYEKALDEWLKVEPRAPDDLELHSEIVQALFALGRFADAEPWREKVRQIHAASKDERIRRYTGFCFDRFTVDGLKVRAFEEYDRSEDALYRYVFEVSRDEKIVRRINLEPGPVAPTLGIPGGDFLLGADDDEGHATFDKRWKPEPPYPELKAAVIDAIRGKLTVVSGVRRPGRSPGAGK